MSPTNAPAPATAARCYESNLYMPVVAAAPEGVTPADYYAQLVAAGVTLTVGPAADHDGLDITVAYPPQVTQSVGDPPQSVPFSTVFSMTGGFVTFYPDDVPLTLPDGQTLPASANPTPDAGTLLLTIWGPDFQYLDQRVLADGPRPTTLVYRGLQTSTVQAALDPEVRKMPKRALIKSWKDAGGQGPTPADAALAQAHLDRVVSGDGAVFLAGGTPFGEAVTTPGAATTAQLTLQAFSADAQDNVTFISPQALILALGVGDG